MILTKIDSKIDRLHLPLYDSLSGILGARRSPALDCDVWSERTSHAHLHIQIRDKKGIARFRGRSGGQQAARAPWSLDSHWHCQTGKRSPAQFLTRRNRRSNRCRGVPIVAPWQKDASLELTACSSQAEMNARNYADRCSRAMAAGTNYEFLSDDSGSAHSGDWRALEGRPPRRGPWPSRSLMFVSHSHSRSRSYFAPRDLFDATDPACLGSLTLRSRLPSRSLKLGRAVNRVQYSG
jgi:hypothetical protein